MVILIISSRNLGMTAYKLEGFRMAEVLPSLFLELNKDLCCSKRNKVWVTSEALIHIKIEILF